MTEKKKTGWFRESARHSLASKGVKTGERQKPRTPRVPRATPRKATPSEEKVKGNQASMRLFPEEDPDFGREFTDSDGKLLVLVGEYIDEKSGERRTLILQTDDGERVERKASEVEEVAPD